MNAMKTCGGTIVLEARTAADMMTTNPVLLQDNATLREAIALLVDKGISGAPVIDEVGRPVGVLTQTDILMHDREVVEHVSSQEVEYGSPLPSEWWDDFQVERVDTTLVRDRMTPAVFSVVATASAWEVLEQICELNVHRLFVVDEQGILVGVISAIDVLRHLSPAGTRD